MAPKKNNGDHGQRSKSPGQTSASDPNPTATSPSASSPRGDATTASLLPFLASHFALPTTTTTIQHIPSAPPETTSLLPVSPSQITATTQPLPSAPPPPIRRTHQERISFTSDGATTTDVAGPSTAPSPSAASTDDYMSLFTTALLEAFGGVEALKSTVKAAEMLLAEREKRDGSSGSCSGSKGAGGGPDSDSDISESDDEGGGVSV